MVDSTHPYVTGAILQLDYVPADCGSKTLTIHAKVRHTFEPFTKSQALLIELLGPSHDLPHLVVLKLYDRRYINDREEYEQPWSPERESVATVRWQAIESGGADLDWENREYDLSELDEAQWEGFFEHESESRYRQETEAYHRLQSLQGGCVPRLYGTVKLQYDVNDIRGPHQIAPGVVIEYLSGCTMDQQEDWSNLREDVDAVVALLVAVDRFASCGIMHCDIRPGNIMVIRKPRIRLVVFDFGHAVIRHPDITDEEWADVVQHDDIGDLRYVLSGVNVRDKTPNLPSSPSALIMRRDEPGMHSERWYGRWHVQVDPLPGYREDATRCKWYRMKPKVYTWLETKPEEDLQYWAKPRPNSPAWTAL